MVNRSIHVVLPTFIKKWLGCDLFTPAMSRQIKREADCCFLDMIIQNFAIIVKSKPKSPFISKNPKAKAAYCIYIT